MYWIIALADSNAQPTTLLDVLFHLFPWLVCFVLIFLLMIPAVSHVRRVSEINERIMRDCDLLEEKLDKIIEILERGPI